VEPATSEGEQGLAFYEHPLYRVVPGGDSPVDVAGARTALGRPKSRAHLEAVSVATAAEAAHSYTCDGHGPDRIRNFEKHEHVSKTFPRRVRETFPRGFRACRVRRKRAFNRVPIGLLQQGEGGLGGGHKSKISRFARRATGPGFGICAPRALEVRSRFSCWSTKKRDFTSDFGGGTTAGAPTWPRVRPRHNQCCTEAVSRTPLSLMLFGEC
jgi:hypothetical protein